MATLTFVETRDPYKGCYYYATLDGKTITSVGFWSPSPYNTPAGQANGTVAEAQSYIISNKVYVESASASEYGCYGSGGFSQFVPQALSSAYWKSLTSSFKPIDESAISTYLATLHSGTGISYDKLTTYASELVTYLKTKNIKLIEDLTSSTSIAEIKSFFSLDNDFDTMLPVWAITLRVSTATLSSMKSSIVSALEAAGITANTINTTDALLIVKRFLPPTADDIEQLASIIALSLGVDTNLILTNRSRIVDYLTTYNVAMKDVLTTSGLQVVDDAIAQFKPAPIVYAPPEVPFYEAYPTAIPPTVVAPAEFPWLWVGIGTAVAVLFIVPSVIILRRR